MIKIDKAEVFGWEAAIRGLRNPMNSWDKSDSKFWAFTGHDFIPMVRIGENDLALMKKLSKAGNDHAKFLRYIWVSFDVEAPLYWWKEMETYRVGVAENPTDIEFNSCSTMHKIHEKEFALDDFSHEHLVNERSGLVLTNRDIFPRNLLGAIVSELNKCRELFLETKDKKYWWQMIQLLPSSYNQKRTVQINYQALKNMYHARKNHKLDEWRELCKWIEGLPYAEDLIVDVS